MAEIEKKPLKITETILRDAHQSLIATRMTTEQMLPIVDKMDKVGYHAVECWGGATFDASLRFLKEDPWERLRKDMEKKKFDAQNSDPKEFTRVYQYLMRRGFRSNDVLCAMKSKQ